MPTLLRLTWVELKLFLREPTTLVFTFAFPVVLLFVMGEIFGSGTMGGGELFGDLQPLDYYVPAYVALTTMSVGIIMLPARLTSYRAGGVLRRFRASLVPVPAVLGSQVLAGLVLALIGGVLVWLFGDLVYEVRLPGDPLQLVAAFLISVAAFSAIGALIGAVVKTSRAAQGAGLMLFFVMLFLSGAGPPTEVMSSTMTRIADFLPLTYAVYVLQDAWNGRAWDGQSYAVLGVISLLAGWLSLRLYKWD
jgi:ABC-2 type transport system permease protein